MLPWMCGRQTLTIVVSSPCITHATMIVAVIAPRLATGGAIDEAPSPLIAGTPSSAALGYGGARHALGDDHQQLELFGISIQATIAACRMTAIRSGCVA